MSAKLGLKLVYIGVVGMVVGSLGAKFLRDLIPPKLSNSESGQIEMASIDKRIERLPRLEQPQFKHLSAISVRLFMPEFIPEDGLEAIELKGTVTLNQGSGSDILEVQWLLPEDVQILSGSPQFQLTDAQPGQVYPISVMVTGFNKTDKKIVSLVVTTVRDGVKLGGSSLITSRPEDSLEYLASERASTGPSEIDTAPREGSVIK